MKIKTPKYIYVPNEAEKYEYRLFVSYSKPINSDIWEWTVSYVGDHGFLYTKSSRNLKEIEMDVFTYINEKNYEFD